MSRPNSPMRGPGRPMRVQTQAQEVTLEAPRPTADRLTNEYVETPFEKQKAKTKASPNIKQNGGQHCPKKNNNHNHNHQKNHNHQNQNHSHKHHHQDQHDGILSSQLQPITKQPVSFTKEPSGGASGSSRGLVQPVGLSIICERCGKCRCESCREPPPLPSRWLCDNSCYCSAETIVDYTSCLCCVKGLFYHCADNGGSIEQTEIGAGCADEPCSCIGPRRGARWACLSALSLLLPCLLCYWPLKGCVACCQMCYAEHATKGCRCEPRFPESSINIQSVSSSSIDAPEKRLLDHQGPEL